MRFVTPPLQQSTSNFGRSLIIPLSHDRITKSSNSANEDGLFTRGMACVRRLSRAMLKPRLLTSLVVRLLLAGQALARLQEAQYGSEGPSRGEDEDSFPEPGSPV
jgi:hypothetical protein